METVRNEHVSAAVRAVRDDRVIAAVRAARDAYGALHGHDIAAIFKDLRALQDESGHRYVRDLARMAQAAMPAATQLSAAVRQVERSLGPVLERLSEWSAAGVPMLDKLL